MAKAWRGITVSRMVSVQGGYGGAAAQTVESKDIIYDGRVTSFIRISKTTHWILKACGGRTCQRGGLRTTQIIGEIRDKLTLCEEELPAGSAVAVQ
jgi:hypothetical protein